MDLNATMVACLAGTDYTHSKDLQDTFAGSCKAFNKLFNDVGKEHQGNRQAAFNAFSSNPRAHQFFAAIKRICIMFETKQRYGIHHRVKSPSASGYVHHYEGSPGHLLIEVLLELFFYSLAVWRMHKQVWEWKSGIGT